MPPPRLGKNFLQRIKDQTLQRVEQRIRQELAPELGPAGPDSDVPVGEELSEGFGQRIRRTIKEKVRQLSPVQRRMLDPNAALDDAAIKYRIRYAGQNRLLLFMLYGGSWRHIEPYSYRYRGKGKSLRFMGYCRLHDQIHSFNPNKIQGLIVTDEPFTPRWPIEVA